MTSWAAAAILAAQIGRLAETQAPATPPQPASQASPQQALSIDGHVSLSSDILPAQSTSEFRPQLMIDVRGGLGGTMFRYRVQSLFEALVANRESAANGAIARVRDVWIEAAGGRGDLRVGYGRLVWGRLDEIQPTDVINPLDVSRFLLDGRAEARLPVAFVRGRLFAREGLTIEGVLAPVFARGRFDELEESSSPFNLLRDVRLPLFPDTALGLRQIEPDRSASNMSGGARVSTTVGRLDVAASVYRGHESFGLITVEPDPVAAPDQLVPVTLVERYPRFTMVGADFETVRGDWALRGEAGFFVDKRLLDSTRTTTIPARALDAGVGFDRRSGDYRVFGSVIVHREWSSRDALIERTDVNLVASIDRQLARDRYFVRGFVVVNPGDGSAFIRALFVWKLRDDLSVEGSAAGFAGTSDDTLGRFADRDFLLLRIRYRW